MNQAHLKDLSALNHPLNKPAPDWFNWALEQPCLSRSIEVLDCDIHYLQWPSPAEVQPERGILFVHGGGAHANWWRFIAPFFANKYRVAAIDLSGMGDSGRREKYSAEMRAQELRAVLKDADLGDHAFIVGHSFGGFMTLRFGAEYGDEIAGAVIVDTPVRRPDDPPPGRAKRIFSHIHLYPHFEDVVARFRLLPAQACENEYMLEFIAKYSVKEVEGGWNWKFDPHAMGADRWQEPFHEHMQNMKCRTAYIHAQNSALIEPKHVKYITSLLKPGSPVIEIPDAHHHLMLDQPLAFVGTLRALLQTWQSSG